MILWIWLRSAFISLFIKIDFVCSFVIRVKKSCNTIYSCPLWNMMASLKEKWESFSTFFIWRFHVTSRLKLLRYRPTLIRFSSLYQLQTSKNHLITMIHKYLRSVEEIAFYIFKLLLAFTTFYFSALFIFSFNILVM